jgi:hypothetical protein
MNELIKDLLADATEVVDDRKTDISHQVVDYKIFAQSVALECAKICETIAEQAELTNTGEMARKTKATAINCAYFIKNRFGVK